MYSYPALTNGNYFVPIAITPEEHSMDISLNKYLEIKIHPLIETSNNTQISISGKFDRMSGISIKEKDNKPFNFMRPTVLMDFDKIEVNCFPGMDYVFHYSNIIKSYASINNKSFKIDCKIPTEEACWEALMSTTLIDIPKVDTVIMGYVQGLDFISNNKTWLGNGNFLYKYADLKSGKAILLGCKHTYWGEIAGRIVTILALLGVKRIIYSGKLGTLEMDYEPNSTLATGNSSILPNGKIIQWENCFDGLYNKEIHKGIHITIPSVLQESKVWVMKNKEFASFVDPEIGHMAYAAQQMGIQFSYLHIISDNLSKKYLYDLSNERKKEVLDKRRKLLKIVGEAIASL